MNEEQQEEARSAQARTLEILPKVLAGDQAAFDELHALHDPFLRSLARRLLHVNGKNTKLDDVSQEVWLRVVDGRAVYVEEKTFRSWLLGVTAKVCLEVKKAARRAQAQGGVESVGTSSLAPERNDLVNDVHAALAELPPEAREVLVLRCVEGMTLQEIADHLGTSKSGVERAFTEAKKLIGPRLAAWAPKPNE